MRSDTAIVRRLLGLAWQRRHHVGAELARELYWSVLLTIDTRVKEYLIRDEAKSFRQAIDARDFDTAQDILDRPVTALLGSGDNVVCAMGVELRFARFKASIKKSAVP